jgi:hypothetical protein
MSGMSASAGGVGGGVCECCQPLPKAATQSRKADPLHLFGERDPTGRHVFECALYGRVLCLRRAVFGLGCSLSIPVRP